MIPIPTIVQRFNNLSEIRRWLIENIKESKYTIGIYGKYSFLDSDDALIFVMKFGGKIIQHENSII